MSLFKEFASFLAIKENSNGSQKVVQTVQSQIVKKVGLFEATKKRPENLKKLFYVLLAFKPTCEA